MDGGDLHIVANHNRFARGDDLTCDLGVCDPVDAKSLYTSLPTVVAEGPSVTGRRAFLVAAARAPPRVGLADIPGSLGGPLSTGVALALTFVVAPGIPVGEGAGIGAQIGGFGL